MKSPSTEEKQRAKKQFEADGFFLSPPVLDPDFTRLVSERMDAVLAGEYETGAAPLSRNYEPGEGKTNLQKIDSAQFSDRVLQEAISSSGIGEWAAAITGADMVQVFTTQMLVKPPGKTQAGNVGWHQDLEYWSSAARGELFTAWLAISDVTESSGPMRFVRGSHRWGLLQAGDFFGGNLDEIKKRILDKSGGTWEEVSATLPPGAVSFHHGLTVHGSGPNVESRSRKSFAIHLRTEKSNLAPGVSFGNPNWLHDWSDEKKCPVIYRRNAASVAVG